MLKHAGFYTALYATHNVNEIISDILIYNHKDDSGSSRTACIPAFIDLKKSRVDKIR